MNPMLLLPELLLHLGPLHPFERGLAVALAFGPFVVLGIVIAVQRRRGTDEDDSSEAPGETGAGDLSGSRPARRGRSRTPW